MLLLIKLHIFIKFSYLVVTYLVTKCFTIIVTYFFTISVTKYVTIFYLKLSLIVVIKSFYILINIKISLNLITFLL